MTDFSYFSANEFHIEFRAWLPFLAIYVNEMILNVFYAFAQQCLQSSFILLTIHMKLFLYT